MIQFQQVATISLVSNNGIIIDQKYDDGMIIQRYKYIYKTTSKHGKYNAVSRIVYLTESSFMSRRKSSRNC
jgi:hypothetical protein